jgi:hypothetical protein
VWRPDDDIDGAFKKAKDATLALIPLYASIKSLDPELAVELPSEAGDGDGQGGDEFDFAATLRVLSETRARELGAAVRRDADAAFVEAKRSTVSSIAQIPVWMYGVLVVLGWNEAMAVLFNPLYFTMLLVGMATACVSFHDFGLILLEMLTLGLQIRDREAQPGRPAIPDHEKHWWRGMCWLSINASSR